MISTLKSYKDIWFSSVLDLPRWSASGLVPLLVGAYRAQATWQKHRNFQDLQIFLDPTSQTHWFPFETSEKMASLESLTTGGWNLWLPCAAKVHREFVLFSSNQAYPELVVCFKLQAWRKLGITNPCVRKSWGPWSMNGNTPILPWMAPVFIDVNIKHQCFIMLYEKAVVFLKAKGSNFNRLPINVR